MSRSEVAEAIAEFGELIEAYTSPVHYALPVSEERFQADKQKALQKAEEPRPLRDGGP